MNQKREKPKILLFGNIFDTDVLSVDELEEKIQQCISRIQPKYEELVRALLRDGVQPPKLLIGVNNELAEENTITITIARTWPLPKYYYIRYDEDGYMSYLDADLLTGNGYAGFTMPVLWKREKKLSRFMDDAVDMMDFEDAYENSCKQLSASIPCYAEIVQTPNYLQFIIEYN